VEGKDFRLADEVRYIQRRAANHHGRIVAVGQLILFSTETGDAWLLDPADGLAARLARDGENEPIHIEETDTTFAIGWKGRYRIEGPAFVYSDNDSGRVTTILGYPADQLAQIGRSKNFKYVWLVFSAKLKSSVPMSRHKYAWFRAARLSSSLSVGVTNRPVKRLLFRVRCTPARTRDF
jgi:hypothetical protein